MRNNKILLFFCYVLLLSCQEQSAIGTSSLGVDNVAIEKSDDFELNSRTISGKPFISYFSLNSNNGEHYLVGNYEDSQFGNTEAQLYLKLIRNVYSGDSPIFDGATIDSTVMVLSYDSTFIYGPSDVSFNYEVFEITDNLDLVDTFWTDKISEVNPDVLGVATLPFKPAQSINIIAHVTGKDTVLGPQIRIPLHFNPSFFTDDNFKDDASFYELIKGVNVRASSTENNAMLSLLFNSTTDAENGQNGIYVYYTDKDGVKQEYKIFYSIRKYNYLKSGFENSINGHVLNDYDQGKDLVYAQGLGGPRIEIQFSDIRSKLEGKAINNATLEITIANIDNEDYIAYPPISQLSGAYVHLDESIVIRDVLLANTSGTDISETFGGNSITTNNITTYTLSITNHIQEILRDETRNETLILSPYILKGNASRSIIIGAKGSSYPMKLSVIYTDGR